MLSDDEVFYPIYITTDFQCNTDAQLTKLQAISPTKDFSPIIILLKLKNCHHEISNKNVIEITNSQDVTSIAEKALHSLPKSINVCLKVKYFSLELKTTPTMYNIQ